MLFYFLKTKMCFANVVLALAINKQHSHSIYIICIEKSEFSILLFGIAFKFSFIITWLDLVI